MVPPDPPAAADLAARVLAHERILQSLIAYMALTEPRFTEHLRARFIDPMRLARREHDHRDVHDYAEEFVRAVIALDERPGRETAPEKAAQRPAPTPDARSRAAALHPVRDAAERVTLFQRNGVWQIRVDGAFWGDYCEHAHALAALAVAKLSLR